MQEITFTIKVPKEMTKEEVLETITDSVSNFIGENERPGMDYRLEKQMLKALQEAK